MKELKDWEKMVSSSKENLWVVTTKCQSFLCSKVKGVFFVKTDIKTIIPLAYIITAEKI